MHFVPHRILSMGVVCRGFVLCFSVIVSTATRGVWVQYDAFFAFIPCLSYVVRHSPSTFPYLFQSAQSLALTLLSLSCLLCSRRQCSSSRAGFVFGVCVPSFCPSVFGCSVNSYARGLLPILWVFPLWMPYGFHV